jgi:hypothetical protein
MMALQLSRESKHLLPFATEIFDNISQPLKGDAPIVVTLSGRDTDSNLEQLEKASKPIVSIPSGSERAVRALHHANAQMLIVDNPWDNTRLESEEQRAKA